LSGGYSEARTVRHKPDTVLSRNREAHAGTGLGFSHFLFGFLNLSEGFNVGQNVYFAESTYARASYGLHAASNLSLCRIFGLEAFGAHGLLHKVTPALNYSYTPRTRSAGFFGRPRFDTLPVASQLGVNLANDFQVKVGPELTKRDLGNLNLSSSFDFNTDSLSPIAANLDLNLIELQRAGFDLSGNTSFDPYAQHFGDYSVNSRLSYGFTLRDSIRKLEQNFSIALSHYLSKQQNMLAAELRLEPKGWKIGVTGGWNIKDRRITDYTIDVVKDLHCWELVANLSRLGSRWTYDFKLRIKAIPDVQIGKGLFGSLLP
jgi:hypothetical protein